MPTSTTNYRLIKPGQDEFYDVAVPNANMDSIDLNLKTLQDAISTGASEQELEILRQALAAHKAESMPHQFTASDDKKYNYGFKTNAAKDGLIFVFEEVL